MLRNPEIFSRDTCDCVVWSKWWWWFKSQTIFHQYSQHGFEGYFHSIYIHGLSPSNFVITMQGKGRKAMSQAANVSIGNSFQAINSLRSNNFIFYNEKKLFMSRKYWIPDDLFFEPQLNLFVCDNISPNMRKIQKKWLRNCPLTSWNPE